MATNPSTLAENVGRITPADANYTYGSAKDDTTGAAGDGTPIKKAVMNDSYGFFQAAMVAAGIVPSGNAETVLKSQILQALQGVVGSFSDKSQWPTVALGVDTEHDIVFSAGKITDSAGKLPIVTAGLTKQIDVAWAVGTNVGGLFSGSVAASTTYHLFLIVRDADGVVDAGFDIDPAAANIPAGYTAFRRIASIYTDASSNIVQFYQRGDYFGLRVPFRDLNLTVVDTAVNNVTLSTPTGLTCLRANLSAFMQNSTGQQLIRVMCLEEDDTVVPNSDNTTLFSGFGSTGFTGDAPVVRSYQLYVSAAGQIKYKAFNSNSDNPFVIITDGWEDDRG